MAGLIHKFFALSDSVALYSVKHLSCMYPLSPIIRSPDNFREIVLLKKETSDISLHL